MTSISIVEDNEIILERLLERVSHMPIASEVHSYSSGESALKGFIANPPDIAIMDIGLPGMSGTEEEGAEGVVAAIKEHLKGGSPMSRSIALKVLQSFRKGHKSKHSPKLSELTNQQYKILDLMAKGLLNKEIADCLGLTEGSIKQHNNRIYKKLSLNNRGEAIRLYLQNTESL